MNARVLILCSITCICLIAWYAYVEMHLPSRKGGEVRQAQKLFPIEKKDILGITVRGDSLVCLERYGSVWWITAPIQTQADQKEVGNLISSIINLRNVRSLGADDRHGQFGLEMPGLMYALRTMKGEYILSISDKTPTSHFFYAKVSGRPDIILIPAQKMAGLAKDFFSLQNKHLVAMSEVDVNRLKFVKHGMIAEFMRDPSGIWHLSADDGRRVDQKRVGMFIHNICGSEALAYLENQGVPETPDAVIELSSPTHTEKIDIWEQDGNVYTVASLKKNKVRIDGSLLEMIPVEAGDVLDKAFIALAEKRVGKIALSGKEERVFSKHGNQWYAGKEKIDDSSALNSFIRQLNSLEYVDEYLRIPKEAGRKLGIRIYYEGTSPAFDITIYSQYYVTVGGKIYRINEGDMENLRKSADALFEGA